MFQRRNFVNRIKVGIIVAVSAALMLTGCTAEGSSTGQGEGVAKEDLRFVIVPKVIHPWFDEVNKGAVAQAELLSQQLGVDVSVDYRAPQNADVAEQNSVLEQAAATQPDGIALDPLDYNGNRAVIEEIQAQGIPVILFDAPSPEGSGLTSVGNDFAEQARLASVALAELVGEQGSIAVMAGVPTAPNHVERFESHLATLAQYPGITVVDGGISNDSIEESQTQAAAVIAANPGLKGYLCVDAACPIGVATAIEEAGKVGEIEIVGMDNLIEVLNFVKSGTMHATSSTMPQMQGAMSVQMLWLTSLGVEVPALVDTGVAFIDAENVDEWIEMVK
jgi:ribose transport system substrate-binding protein